MIYAPTDAIACLDAIRALRTIGVKKMVLRTIKPPSSLGVETSKPLLP
ncbi:MAG: hypothetical protein ABWW69_00935 [Pyrodictiaceae archaeon]